ncbi:hypothetical protein VCHA53O466_50016 [Vibrio chagasii]|nr:hypothetical protein VCHA53O466_50016 [Vibrio chagasii]
MKNIEVFSDRNDDEAIELEFYETKCGYEKFTIGNRFEATVKGSINKSTNKADVLSFFRNIASLIGRGSYPEAWSIYSTLIQEFPTPCQRINAFWGKFDVQS